MDKHTVKLRHLCSVALTAAIASTLFAAAGLLASQAAAEVGASTPTVQAVSANAAWLPYAPPPAVPGVVCLVDSGVDTNPDTEAAIVGSHELYPETGPGDEVARLAPTVDGHPDGHGTLMAMLASAPINSWGMIGIAPQDRVYNMKALADGETDFHDDILAEAITTCARLQKAEYPTMKTINLSLGGETAPEPTIASEVEDAITAAKRQGIAVMVAAGNTGGPLTFPAAYAGAVSVGAADAGVSPGTLCPFSARGADILAPGCDSKTGGVEGAWQDTGEPDVSEGTSQADTIESSIYEAMIDYAPTLTEMQAEECIISTANHGEIDAAAAFDDCGLAAIVEAGLAAEPKPPPLSGDAEGASGQAGQPVSASCTAGACQPTPRKLGTLHIESFEHACQQPVIAHAVRTDKGVRVVARGPQRGCELQVRLRYRGRWRILRRRRAATRLQFAAPRGARIQVRFQGTAGLAPSPWTTVRASEPRGT